MAAYPCTHRTAMLELIFTTQDAESVRNVTKGDRKSASYTTTDAPKADTDYPQHLRHTVRRVGLAHTFYPIHTA
ncbi:hypothetical protein [Candidatus Nitrotoga arctica]|uniref:hypothetical protein n=1 Tax=Candidatus Nitrotoga arctica TaxID=453162 RepID=UPI001EFA82F6|nr:hypothetical protein [Candidatus Nitrotoga arctica]